MRETKLYTAEKISFLALGSVEKITKKRMTDISHMYPYLVSSTCVQNNVTQGIFANNFFNKIFGNRRLSVGGDDSFHRAFGLSAYGRINKTVIIFWHACN